MIFSQELYIIPFLRSLMAVSIFYSATCMTIFLGMLGKVSGYAWVFCIAILYVCLCVEAMRTLQILWWIPGARLQFCARVMRAWSPKGETIPDSRFFCIAVLDCNCRWMVDFCGGCSVIFLYIFQIFL